MAFGDNEIRVQAQLMEDYRTGVPVKGSSSLCAAASGSSSHVFFIDGENIVCLSREHGSDSDTGWKRSLVRPDAAPTSLAAAGSALLGVAVAARLANGILVVLVERGGAWVLLRGDGSFDAPALTGARETPIDLAVIGNKFAIAEAHFTVNVPNMPPVARVENMGWLDLNGSEHGRYSVRSVFSAARDIGAIGQADDTAPSPVSRLVLFDDGAGHPTALEILGRQCLRLRSTGNPTFVDVRYLQSPPAAAAVRLQGQGAGAPALLIAADEGLHIINNPSSPDVKRLTSGVYRWAGALDAGSGNVDLMLLSVDHKLYRQRLKSDGEAEPPIKLASAVQAVTCWSSSATSQHIVFDSGGSLHELVLDESSGAAFVGPIEIDDHQSVVRTISYRAEVSLMPSVAPLERLMLRSDEPVVVEVNGQAQWLEPGSDVEVQTDGVGRLVIQYPATTLAAPHLQLRRKADPNAKPWFVLLDQSVRSRLGNLQATDLMAATRSRDGGLLLSGIPEAERVRTAEAVAKACQLLVSATQEHPSPVLNSAPLTTLRPMAGGLRLTFANGGVRHEVLPDMELNAAAPVSFATAGFLDDIAAFFGALWDGAVEIAEIVLTPVANGVRAVLKFASELGERVIQGVIDKAHQAMDLIAGLFHRAQVAFNDLREWLAFVFNWRDILLAKEAISHVALEALNVLPDLLHELKLKVDQTADQALKNIETYRDAMITRLGGMTPGQVQHDSNPPEAFQKGLANNVVLDTLLRDRSSGPSSSQLIPSQKPAAVTQAINAIEAAGNTFNASEEFKQAIQYLRQACESFIQDPRQAANLALSGLVQAIATLARGAMTLVKTVLDAFIEGVSALIKALIDLISAPIELPLVSSLYRYITEIELKDGRHIGGQLSVLDVMSLIAAVPTTVIYKLTYGEAPLTDERLEQFRSLAKRPTQKVHLSNAAFSRAPFPIWFRQFMGISSIASFNLMGLLDSLMLVTQLDGASELSYVAQLASWVTSNSYWYNLTDEVPAVEWFNDVWWCFGSLINGLDAFCLLDEKKTSQFAGDRGILAHAAVGAVYTAVNMWGSATNKWSPDDVLANHLGTAPMFLKLLTLDALKKTEAGPVLCAGVALADTGLYIGSSYFWFRARQSDLRKLSPTGPSGLVPT